MCNTHIRTERVPLHDVLQPEGGEEHQRVPVVDLAELLVVDQPVLVHVELLQSLLKVARKRRRSIVDASEGNVSGKCIFVLV